MFNKIFRRTLAASILLIGASIWVAPIAKAASDNDTVSGEVAAINSVDYTAPGQFTLDPTNGNTDESFGSVTIQNNDNDGWTLTVTSTNSGNLNHATFGNIPYTDFEANRGGGAIDVTITGGTDTVEDVSALTCADSTGCTYNITADIANTAIDGMAAGVYSDTLTFTLMSK